MKRELAEHKKSLTEFSPNELAKCEHDILNALKGLH